MTQFISNDLNTYPPYGQIVIVRLKNTFPFFYTVRREQISKSWNSNEFKDVFTEAAGEEWSYWDVDAIDSWMTVEELEEKWN